MQVDADMDEVVSADDLGKIISKLEQVSLLCPLIATNDSKNVTGSFFYP